MVDNDTAPAVVTLSTDTLSIVALGVSDRLFVVVVADDVVLDVVVANDDDNGVVVVPVFVKLFDVFAVVDDAFTNGRDDVEEACCADDEVDVGIDEATRLANVADVSLADDDDDFGSLAARRIT